jgi:thymidylate kinase
MQRSERQLDSPSPSTVLSRWRSTHGATVALVGPDGSGKSTVSHALVDARLPAPVTIIYMGVNLAAGTHMLPTTRLAMARKKRRSGTADTSGWSSPASRDRGLGTGHRRLVAEVQSGVRLAAWMAEEWYRIGVAFTVTARRGIVVFDRHFLADFFHYDVSGATNHRTVADRVHGFVLHRLMPKPRLVIFLDAPGDVLYARKGEADPEWLDERRAQYLELEQVVPNFVRVDATRPVDEVVATVAELIRHEYLGARGGSVR